MSWIWWSLADPWLCPLALCGAARGFWWLLTQHLPWTRVLGTAQPWLSEPKPFLPQGNLDARCQTFCEEIFEEHRKRLSMIKTG